jgi:hypothetical protein
VNQNKAFTSQVEAKHAGRHSEQITALSHSFEWKKLPPIRHPRKDLLLTLRSLRNDRCLERERQRQVQKQILTRMTAAVPVSSLEGRSAPGNLLEMTLFLSSAII